MRAVNLMPEELRGGSPGRTGNTVYLLLGGLLAAVVLASGWAVSTRQVNDQRAELTKVTAEAQDAEARAGALAPYKQFADLRQKRVDTVTQLSRSRFNWPFALREVSRVLPSDVWLTTLVGTVAPGVQVDDVSIGATTTLRSTLQTPAIEISGCTTGQKQVAEYLARLRSIQGVTRVALADSTKLDTANVAAATGGSGGSGANSQTDCRAGNNRIPQFNAVVFFEGSTATPSTATSGTPATAATNAASAVASTKEQTK